MTDLDTEDSFLSYRQDKADMFASVILFQENSVINVTKTNMKGTKSLERIRGSAVKRFHQNSESWKVAEKCALNETEWKNPQSGSESPEHAPGQKSAGMDGREKNAGEKMLNMEVK